MGRQVVMTGLYIARALHVLGVVVWIGGVYLATTIFLPLVRGGRLGADRLAAFHAVEDRFIWHARAAVLVVGLSGLYMLERLDLWRRFTELRFWWMHAMVIVWTLFALLLFVIEPFVMHRHLARLVARDPDAAFRRLHGVPVVLLALSLITILAAVAGAHGWLLTAE